MNGLRAPVFAPSDATEAFSCAPNCGKDPTKCMFMKMYEIQLAKLDYNDIMKRTEDLCERVRAATDFAGDPIAVFIVHEAPDNPCSERAAIQKFFQCEELDLKSIQKY